MFCYVGQAVSHKDTKEDTKAPKSFFAPSVCPLCLCVKLLIDKLPVPELEPE